MSGHLAFPAIAGEDVPASLSPLFMDELLRDRLGFEGVVVTDDLEMAGAVQYAGSPAQAVVAAIAAGNDLALVSHTQRGSNAPGRLRGSACRKTCASGTGWQPPRCACWRRNAPP